MAKKKQAKPKRERTQAQIDSEHRREESASKTLVRHTPDSAKALADLRKRFSESDPEIMRMALIEFAPKRRR
jgi:hypothetical protein